MTGPGLQQLRFVEEMQSEHVCLATEPVGFFLPKLSNVAPARNPFNVILEILVFLNVLFSLFVCFILFF